VSGAWGFANLRLLERRGTDFQHDWSRRTVTTATLPHKAKSFPMVAPHESVFPCRSALAKLLSEHGALVTALGDMEAKLSRSQLDLDHAIDADNDEAIDRYQSQCSIYGVKTVAKKTNLSRIMDQFPPLISNCANEYGTALLSERERRCGILAARIAEILGSDATRLIEGRYLDDVLDLSVPIQQIDHLRFSFSLVNVSDEAVLLVAKHLLDCYSELLSMTGEAI
jgi:hypothetical protein